MEIERKNIRRNKKSSMDELPDDLLIYIISLLPAEERTRTSVVARRWRNFWKLILILNFDDSEIYQELLTHPQLGKRIRARELATKRLVTNVNEALLSHSGKTLDELRIKSGSLDDDNTTEIDSWLDVALRKGVRKLELNFKADTQNDDDDEAYVAYTFPDVGCFDVPPHGLSLVSLSLIQVHLLSEEFFEDFISNCPNLEHLHIENATGLEGSELSIQAARLRRLALINCEDLKKVEVCSSNLVSYELLSSPNAYARTKLSGVPSLIHLSLGAYSYDELLFQQLGDVSGCLSRLETLKLRRIVEPKPRLSRPRKVEFEFPSLPRLRKLVLEIDINGEASILRFTPLIHGAPLLEQIVLTLMECGNGGSRKPERAALEMGEKHECVKVLEINNYLGKAVDVEFALYVMDYAASLEQVVIDDVASTGEDLHLLKTNLLKKL